MRIYFGCIAVFLMGLVGLWAQEQNTAPKKPQISEANGMPPRATPADYPSHVQAGAVTIAAEFMGHSVPRLEGPLSTDDYVVVETGFFGAPGARINLSLDDFSLRINEKKSPLPNQPYELVAQTVKDPDWAPPEQQQSKSKTKFGSGGGGQSDANSPPPPVHVPIELQRAMAQHIQKSSLPQGDRALPVAGLIFFQYHGKAQSIHSLELIYSGAAGKATLTLQP